MDLFSQSFLEKQPKDMKLLPVREDGELLKLLVWLKFLLLSLTAMI
jgi:hypothetical protein